MALVEIPINSYKYHFKSLSWMEEAALSAPAEVSASRVILAAALQNVSGLPVSKENAAKILQPLPDLVVLRIWQQYRVELPGNRYFNTSELYRAPEARSYQGRVDAAEEARDRIADRAHAQVAPADEVSKAMFENAKRSGNLAPAKGE